MRTVTFLVCAVLLTGCGGDVVPSAIVVSGRLVEGAQIQPQNVSRGLVPRESGDPLAGYQLYCVTFASPPIAAVGTADVDGNVSIELDAAGVPFGCFVLDTEGTAVATLIFSDGLDSGQTVTLSESTDLGGIIVDLSNSVAMAPNVPAGQIATSDDMPCPLGTWVTDVPRDDGCTGTTVSFTISQEPDEGYLVSFILGPIWMSEAGGCVNHCMSGLVATESSAIWAFSFQHDPQQCPSRMMDVELTPGSECGELTVNTSYGPCLSCTEGQCGCEEGTETCTGTYTAIRE